MLNEERFLTYCFAGEFDASSHFAYVKKARCMKKFLGLISRSFLQNYEEVLLLYILKKRTNNITKFLQNFFSKYWGSD